MQIQALKCTLDGDILRADGETLDIESPRNFGEKKAAVPTAYVISLPNLGDLIKSYRDLIEDRGEKDPAIQLSRRLLGRKKIPAINISSKKGGYGSVKRTMNGIRDFLKQAEAHAGSVGDKNVFLLGASQELLEALFCKINGSLGILAPTPMKEPTREETTCLESPARLIDLLCNVNVPEELEKEYVGNSEPVRLVRKLIMRVAAFKDPVLILGDTGTGKEIVAKQIHYYSGRKKRNFRAINCAAIPSELFESELFGIEDKVATSVGKRIGKWELANGGTLFLDEIGELSLNHQAKILRALQDNIIMRVGGSVEIIVDARVIAATNKNLFSLVQRKKFREDLYYRLRGLLIPTPAVREHPEDIPLLADHLWEKITDGKEKKLSRKIISELCSYSWPGNVRELYMVLSGLHSLFYDLPEIEVKHLRGFFAHQRQVTWKGFEELNGIRSGREQLEYLDSLNKMYDIVKAAQISVQPILDADADMVEKKLPEIRFSLQYRLDELNLRLQGDSRPMPRPVYDTISRLQSTLLYFFRIMERDLMSAVSDLKSNAPPDFGAAIASLTDEIRKIKENGFTAVS